MREIAGVKNPHTSEVLGSEVEAAKGQTLDIVAKKTGQSRNTVQKQRKIMEAVARSLRTDDHNGGMIV